jgi:hypothetical protein
MPKAVRSSACAPPDSYNSYTARSNEEGRFTATGKKKTRNSTRLSSLLFRGRGHRLSFFLRPGRSGQFLQREITRPPNLTAYRLSYLIIHYLLISTTPNNNILCCDRSLITLQGRDCYCYIRPFPSRCYCVRPQV